MRNLLRQLMGSLKELPVSEASSKKSEATEAKNFLLYLFWSLLRFLFET